MNALAWLSNAAVALFVLVIFLAYNIGELSKRLEKLEKQMRDR